MAESIALLIASPEAIVRFVAGRPPWIQMVLRALNACASSLIIVELLGWGFEGFRSLKQRRYAQAVSGIAAALFLLQSGLYLLALRMSG